MRFPQEVVVQRFLPTYRTMLARGLADEGLPQADIAELVGVSQAQVSKYLGGEVDVDDRLAGDPRVQATVDELVEGLATDRLDTVTALARSLRLIRRLENRGPLCDLHAEAMPALEGTGCDACLEPEGRVMAEHQALVDVRTALRRLTALDGLAAWIPHVGSNLAQAVEGAEGPWDVAALPGRIDAVGERPRATTEPRLGGSRHVATVVLAVMDVHPGHRAAVNLAYRGEMLERAEDADLGHVGFEPAYEGRREEVARRLREAEGSGPPGVLYQEGAFGIEPVTYVLGRDAAEVVDRVATLVARA